MDLISRVNRGLDSKDLATFRESCGIISNLYASYVQRLLEIASSRENGKDEGFRIRFAVETLGNLKCLQVIPLCIERLDFANRTGYVSESDPFLHGLPFARCLANFEKPGVDAVLDYLGYGDNPKDSERRLAIFSYVLQAGFENERLKGTTLIDYAKSHKRPRSGKHLDQVIKLLQLSPSDLGKMIEQQRPNQQ
jgi:hypothetical protein